MVTTKIRPKLLVNLSGRTPEFLKGEFQEFLKNTIVYKLDIKWEDLVSKSRKRKLVYARIIYWVLMKETFSKISTVTLGNFFHRDHATVISGFKNNDNMCESMDRAYCEYLCKVVNMLNKVFFERSYLELTRERIGELYEDISKEDTLVV